MLLYWIMNEWHRIRTLITTWLDEEVRSLWLRTSHIVLAQSFSNPLVRSDLPHLLPLRHEKNLLLHPWPVPEKVLSTVECLGMERDEGIIFAAVASLAITVVPDQQQRESNSLPSFGGRGVTFLPKSLQWLSANYNSSDDIPALAALLLILRSKPNQSTVHTAMPIFHAFPPQRHSQCLWCLLALPAVTQLRPPEFLPTLQHQ